MSFGVEKINKFFAVLFLSVLLYLVSGMFYYASAASITGVSCPAPSATASWPRNTFNTTCSVTVDITGETNVKIGIRTANTTTTKLSGNGSNLNYTTPEQRFTANSVNVGTTVADVYTNISSSGDYNVPLAYITYEADYGDTNYQQDFTFVLRRSSDSAELGTSASSITFTIANKQYVSVSASPTVTLTGSSQVFSTDQYYDAASAVTISVKANNTWKVQSKLAGNLISGGSNIPATSMYYKCTANAGFDCLYTTRTQYAAADTYYDIAQENSGDYSTGTSDSINLDAKNVEFTTTLKTTATFDKGDYTTTGTFKVTSPR